MPGQAADQLVILFAPVAPLSRDWGTISVILCLQNNRIVIYSLSKWRCGYSLGMPLRRAPIILACRGFDPLRIYFGPCAERVQGGRGFYYLLLTQDTRHFLNKSDNLTNLLTFKTGRFSHHFVSRSVLCINQRLSLQFTPWLEEAVRSRLNAITSWL